MKHAARITRATTAVHNPVRMRVHRCATGQLSKATARSGALVYGDPDENLACKLFCGHFEFDEGTLYPIRQSLPALNHVPSKRLPLIEIAEGVGHGSEAAFSRAFKRQFDITTGELRRNAN
ncbi:MAG: hypothetical protein AAGB04_17725 [Pseudomonadota bacterium]